MVIEQAAFGQKLLNSNFQRFQGCDHFVLGTGSGASLDPTRKIGFAIPRFTAWRNEK
jgi:hypothetical protein